MVIRNTRIESKKKKTSGKTSLYHSCTEIRDLANYPFRMNRKRNQHVGGKSSADLQDLQLYITVC